MEHDEDRSLSLGTEVSVSVPPPSPLTGCYLLAVIGEPHTDEHKEIILQRLVKGLQSWDSIEHQVDLEKELMTLTAQAPEGEDARNGERLIQFASENLVTEILIHPQMNTLMQCMRNLLSSFTRHRHLIHAGYTAAGNGSWIVQDGTFSLADFTDAYQENEVQRVIRAYENSISIDIHCSTMGGGEWANLPGMSFVKYCKLRVNPTDILDSGSQAIKDFIGYLNPYIIPASLEQLLVPSDVVGNIRFSHPTLYVFPGGQGDAALFGINGFNMLVDGGFSRKACWWDFARHLDRLDAVMLTRVNNCSIAGMAAVLKRKAGANVYPHIGHFFCNLEERRVLSSPDGDKDSDPLLVSLLQEGSDMMADVRHINLKPQHCWRSPDPINLYHKVGHGTLDMYVLNPSKDSKHVRDFLKRWHESEQKLFEGPSISGPFNFPIPNIVSICALLVWRPANPDENVTRLMFPGSTPQHKIFEGLEKLKHLEFLQHPKCTGRQITTTPSPVPTAVHTTVKRSTTKTTKDKILTTEKKDEKTEKESGIKAGKDRITSEKKSEKIFDANQTKDETDSKNYIDNKLITELIDGEDKKIESVLREAITSRVETKLESTSLESITKKQEFKKKDRIITEKKIKRAEKTEDNKEATLKSEVKKAEYENKSKVDARKKIDTKVSSTVTRAKLTQKTSQKLSEKKTVTTTIDKKLTLDKSPPATPKKSSESKATKEPTPPASARLKTKVRKLSPGSAKSTKEANNRRVVESKYKQASPKRELTARPTEKKEIKIKREPLSRRPRPLGSPVKAVKVMKSPTKAAKSIRIDPKLKGLQRVNYEDILKDAKKSDEENSKSIDDFKQDIDDKEEQEIVREIEAVFNRDSEADEKVEYVGRSDIEKITCLITNAKTEVSADTEFEEEYLIIEKEEIDQYTDESALEHEPQQHEDELQKHAKDSKESEKKKDFTEMASQILKEEDVMPVDIKQAESKEHSLSVEEKQDLSSEKKTSDSKNGQAKTKSMLPETQQDEKVSSQITVESGATTTAPTLPEDERITLDDIKEDNQVEEKYDNEETKEIIPPQTLENIPKARKVRDIVKTPDEVADLPLHEEVDYQTFEEKKTPLDDNQILPEESFEKQIEIKDDDVFKRIPDVGFVHEIQVPKNLPLTDPMALTDVQPIEDDVIVTTLQKPSHPVVVTVTPGSAPESPMFPENKEMKDILVGKPLDTVNEYEGADYCYGFTEKLRETHITTVESPLKENANIVEELSCLPDKIPSIPEDVEKEIEEAKLFEGEKSPKSPKEVEKIVASVAEVLKSDKPLEELISPKLDLVIQPVETILISEPETTVIIEPNDSLIMQDLRSDLQINLDVKDTSPARSATPDEGSDGTEKTVLSEAKKQLDINKETNDELRDAILTTNEITVDLRPSELTEDEITSVSNVESESQKTSERKLSSTFETAKTLEKLEEKMAELRKKDEDKHDTESEIVVAIENKTKDLDLSGEVVSQIMPYKVKKKDISNVDANTSTASGEVPIIVKQTDEKTELVENIDEKSDLVISDDGSSKVLPREVKPDVDNKSQDKIKNINVTKEPNLKESEKKSIDHQSVEHKEENKDVVDHTATETDLNHLALELSLNDTQEIKLTENNLETSSRKDSIRNASNVPTPCESKESSRSVSPAAKRDMMEKSPQIQRSITEESQNTSGEESAKYENEINIEFKEVPAVLEETKKEQSRASSPKTDEAVVKEIHAAIVNEETSLVDGTSSPSDHAEVTTSSDVLAPLKDSLPAVADIDSALAQKSKDSGQAVSPVITDILEESLQDKILTPEQSQKTSKAGSPTPKETISESEREVAAKEGSIESDLKNIITSPTAEGLAIPHTAESTVVKDHHDLASTEHEASHEKENTARKDSLYIESQKSSRASSPKTDEAVVKEIHAAIVNEETSLVDGTSPPSDHAEVTTSSDDLAPLKDSLPAVADIYSALAQKSKDSSQTVSPVITDKMDESVQHKLLTSEQPQKSSIAGSPTPEETITECESEESAKKGSIESDIKDKITSPTIEGSGIQQIAELTVVKEHHDTTSYETQSTANKYSLHVASDIEDTRESGSKDSSRSVSPAIKDECIEKSSQDKPASKDQSQKSSRASSPKTEKAIVEKIHEAIDIKKTLIIDGEPAPSDYVELITSSDDLAPINDSLPDVKDKVFAIARENKDSSQVVSPVIETDILEKSLQDRLLTPEHSQKSSKAGSPTPEETITESKSEVAARKESIKSDHKDTIASPTTEGSTIQHIAELIVSEEHRDTANTETETTARKDSLHVATDVEETRYGGSKDSSRSVSPVIKEECIAISSQDKSVTKDQSQKSSRASSLQTEEAIVKEIHESIINEETLKVDGKPAPSDQVSEVTTSSDNLAQTTDSLPSVGDTDLALSQKNKDYIQAVSPVIKTHKMEEYLQDKLLTPEQPQKSSKAGSPTPEETITKSESEVAARKGIIKDETASSTTDSSVISHIAELMVPKEHHDTANTETETTARKDSLHVALDVDDRSDGGSKDSSRSVSPATGKENIEKESQKSSRASSPKTEEEIIKKMQEAIVIAENLKFDGKPAPSDHVKEITSSEDFAPKKDSLPAEEDLDLALAQESKDPSQAVSPVIKTDIQEKSLQDKLLTPEHSQKSSKAGSPTPEETTTKNESEVAARKGSIKSNIKDKITSPTTEGPAIPDIADITVVKEHYDTASPETETTARKESLLVGLDVDDTRDGGSKDSSPLVSPAIKEEYIAKSSQDKPESKDQSQKSSKASTPQTEEAIVEEKHEAILNVETLIVDGKPAPSDQVETTTSSGDLAQTKDRIPTAEDLDLALAQERQDSSKTVSQVIKTDIQEKSLQDKLLTPEQSQKSSKVGSPTPEETITESESEGAARKGSIKTDIKDETASSTTDDSVIPHIAELIVPKEHHDTANTETETTARKDSMHVALDVDDRSDGGSKDSSRSVSPATTTNKLLTPEQSQKSSKVGSPTPEETITESESEVAARKGSIKSDIKDETASSTTDDSVIPHIAELIVPKEHHDTDNTETDTTARKHSLHVALDVDDRSDGGSKDSSRSVSPATGKENIEKESQKSSRTSSPKTEEAIIKVMQEAIVIAENMKVDGKPAPSDHVKEITRSEDLAPKQDSLPAVEDLDLALAQESKDPSQAVSPVIKTDIQEKSLQDKLLTPEHSQKSSKVGSPTPEETITESESEGAARKGSIKTDIKDETASSTTDDSVIPHIAELIVPKEHHDTANTETETTARKDSMHVVLDVDDRSDGGSKDSSRSVSLATTTNKLLTPEQSQKSSKVGSPTPEETITESESEVAARKGSIKSDIKDETASSTTDDSVIPHIAELIVPKEHHDTDNTETDTTARKHSLHVALDVDDRSDGGSKDSSRSVSPATGKENIEKESQKSSRTSSPKTEEAIIKVMQEAIVIAENMKVDGKPAPSDHVKEITRSEDLAPKQDSLPAVEDLDLALAQESKDPSQAVSPVIKTDIQEKSLQDKLLTPEHSQKSSKAGSPTPEETPTKNESEVAARKGSIKSDIKDKIASPTTEGPAIPDIADITVVKEYYDTASPETETTARKESLLVGLDVDDTRDGGSKDSSLLVSPAIKEEYIAKSSQDKPESKDQSQKSSKASTPQTEEAIVEEKHEAILNVETLIVDGKPAPSDQVEMTTSSGDLAQTKDRIPTAEDLHLDLAQESKDSSQAVSPVIKTDIQEKYLQDKLLTPEQSQKSSKVGSPTPEETITESESEVAARKGSIKSDIKDETASSTTEGSAIHHIDELTVVKEHHDTVSTETSSETETIARKYSLHVTSDVQDSRDGGSEDSSRSVSPAIGKGNMEKPCLDKPAAKEEFQKLSISDIPIMEEMTCEEIRETSTINEFVQNDKTLTAIATDSEKLSKSVSSVEELLASAKLTESTIKTEFHDDTLTTDNSNDKNGSSEKNAIAAEEGFPVKSDISTSLAQGSKDFSRSVRTTIKISNENLTTPEQSQTSSRADSPSTKEAVKEEISEITRKESIKLDADNVSKSQIAESVTIKTHDNDTSISKLGSEMESERKDSLQTSDVKVALDDSSPLVSPAIKEEYIAKSSQDKPESKDQSQKSSKASTPQTEEAIVEERHEAILNVEILIVDSKPAPSDQVEMTTSSGDLAQTKDRIPTAEDLHLDLAQESKDSSQAVSPVIKTDIQEKSLQGKLLTPEQSQKSSKVGSPTPEETITESESEVAARKGSIKSDIKDETASSTTDDSVIPHIAELIVPKEHHDTDNTETDTTARKDSLHVALDVDDRSDGGSKDSSRSVSPATGKENIEKESQKSSRTSSPKTEEAIIKVMQEAIVIAENMKVDGKPAPSDHVKKIPRSEDLAPKQDSLPAVEDLDLALAQESKDLSQAVSPVIKTDIQEKSIQDKLLTPDHSQKSSKAGSPTPEETPTKNESEVAARKGSIKSDIKDKIASPTTEGPAIPDIADITVVKEYYDTASPETETTARKESLLVGLDVDDTRDGGSKDSSPLVSPAIKEEYIAKSSQDKPESKDQSQKSSKASTPQTEEAIVEEKHEAILNVETLIVDGKPAPSDQVEMTTSSGDLAQTKDRIPTAEDLHLDLAQESKDSSQAVSPVIKTDIQEKYLQDKLLTPEQSQKSSKVGSPTPEETITESESEVAARKGSIKSDIKDETASSTTEGSAIHHIDELTVVKEHHDTVSTETSSETETIARKYSLHVTSDVQDSRDGGSEDSSRSVSPAIGKGNMEKPCLDKPAAKEEFQKLSISDIPIMEEMTCEEIRETSTINEFVQNDKTLTAIATDSEKLSKSVSSVEELLASAKLTESTIKTEFHDDTLTTDNSNDKNGSSEKNAIAAEVGFPVKSDISTSLAQGSKDSSRSVSTKIKISNENLTTPEQSQTSSRADSPSTKEAVKEEISEITRKESTKLDAENVSESQIAESVTIKTHDNDTSISKLGSEMESERKDSLQTSDVKVALDDKSKDSSRSVSPAIIDESEDKPLHDKPISNEHSPTVTQTGSDNLSDTTVIKEFLQDDVQDLQTKTVLNISASPVKDSIPPKQLDEYLGEVLITQSATNEASQMTEITSEDSSQIFSNIETICTQVSKDLSRSVSPAIQKDLVEKVMQEQSQKSSQAESPATKETVIQEETTDDGMLSIKSDVLDSSDHLSDTTEDTKLPNPMRVSSPISQILESLETKKPHHENISSPIMESMTRKDSLQVVAEVGPTHDSDSNNSIRSISPAIKEVSKVQSSNEKLSETDQSQSKTSSPLTEDTIVNEINGAIARKESLGVDSKVASTYHQKIETDNESLLRKDSIQVTFDAEESLTQEPKDSPETFSPATTQEILKKPLQVKLATPELDQKASRKEYLKDDATDKAAIVEVSKDLSKTSSPTKEGSHIEESTPINVSHDNDISIRKDSLHISSIVETTNEVTLDKETPVRKDSLQTATVVDKTVSQESNESSRSVSPAIQKKYIEETFHAQCATSEQSQKSSRAGSPTTQESDIKFQDDSITMTALKAPSMSSSPSKEGSPVPEIPESVTTVENHDDIVVSKVSTSAESSARKNSTQILTDTKATLEGTSKDSKRSVSPEIIDITKKQSSEVIRTGSPTTKELIKDVDKDSHESMKSPTLLKETSPSPKLKESVFKSATNELTSIPDSTISAPEHQDGSAIFADELKRESFQVATDTEAISNGGSKDSSRSVSPAIVQESKGKSEHDEHLPIANKTGSLIVEVSDTSVFKENSHVDTQSATITETYEKESIKSVSQGEEGSLSSKYIEISATTEFDSEHSQKSSKASSRITSELINEESTTKCYDEVSTKESSLGKSITERVGEMSDILIQSAVSSTISAAEALTAETKSQYVEDDVKDTKTINLMMSNRAEVSDKSPITKEPPISECFDKDYDISISTIAINREDQANRESDKQIIPEKLVSNVIIETCDTSFDQGLASPPLADDNDFIIPKINNLTKSSATELKPGFVDEREKSPQVDIPTKDNGISDMPSKSQNVEFDSKFVASEEITKALESKVAEHEDNDKSFQLDIGNVTMDEIDASHDARVHQNQPDHEVDEAEQTRDIPPPESKTSSTTIGQNTDNTLKYKCVKEADSEIELPQVNKDDLGLVSQSIDTVDHKLISVNVANLETKIDNEFQTKEIKRYLEKNEIPNVASSTQISFANNKSEISDHIEKMSYSSYGESSHKYDTESSTKELKHFKLSAEIDPKIIREEAESNFEVDLSKDYLSQDTKETTQKSATDMLEAIDTETTITNTTLKSEERIKREALIIDDENIEKQCDIAESTLTMEESALLRQTESTDTFCQSSNFSKSADTNTKSQVKPSNGHIPVALNTAHVCKEDKRDDFHEEKQRQTFSHESTDSKRTNESSSQSTKISESVQHIPENLGDPVQSSSSSLASVGTESGQKDQSSEEKEIDIQSSSPANNTPFTLSEKKAANGHVLHEESEQEESISYMSMKSDLDSYDSMTLQDHDLARALKGEQLDSLAETSEFSHKTYSEERDLVQKSFVSIFESTLKEDPETLASSSEDISKEISCEEKHSFECLEKESKKHIQTTSAMKTEIDFSHRESICTRTAHTETGSPKDISLSMTTDSGIMSLQADNKLGPFEGADYTQTLKDNAMNLMESVSKAFSEDSVQQGIKTESVDSLVVRSEFERVSTPPTVPVSPLPKTPSSTHDLKVADGIQSELTYDRLEGAEETITKVVHVGDDILTQKISTSTEKSAKPVKVNSEHDDSDLSSLMHSVGKMKTETDTVTKIIKEGVNVVTQTITTVTTKEIISREDGTPQNVKTTIETTTLSKGSDGSTMTTTDTQTLLSECSSSLKSTSQMDLYAKDIKLDKESLDTSEEKSESLCSQTSEKESSLRSDLSSTRMKNEEELPLRSEFITTIDDDSDDNIEDTVIDTDVSKKIVKEGGLDIVETVITTTKKEFLKLDDTKKILRTTTETNITKERPDGSKDTQKNVDVRTEEINTETKSPKEEAPQSITLDDIGQSRKSSTNQVVFTVNSTLGSIDMQESENKLDIKTDTLDQVKDRLNADDVPIEQVLEGFTKSEGHTVNVDTQEKIVSKDGMIIKQKITTTTTKEILVSDDGSKKKLKTTIETATESKLPNGTTEVVKDVKISIADYGIEIVGEKLEGYDFVGEPDEQTTSHVEEIMDNDIKLTRKTTVTTIRQELENKISRIRKIKTIVRTVIEDEHPNGTVFTKKSEKTSIADVFLKTPQSENGDLQISDAYTDHSEVVEDVSEDTDVKSETVQKENQTIIRTVTTKTKRETLNSSNATVKRIRTTIETITVDEYPNGATETTKDVKITVSETQTTSDSKLQAALAGLHSTGKTKTSVDKIQNIVILDGEEVTQTITTKITKEELKRNDTDEVAVKTVTETITETAKKDGSVEIATDLQTQITYLPHGATLDDLTEDHLNVIENQPVLDQVPHELPLKQKVTLPIPKQRSPLGDATTDTEVSTKHFNENGVDIEQTITVVTTKELISPDKVKTTIETTTVNKGNDGVTKTLKATKTTFSELEEKYGTGESEKSFSKTDDLRSSSAASDDLAHGFGSPPSDLSSRESKATHAWGTESSGLYYSDEDGPGSPSSTKSQIAHSPRSNLSFELEPSKTLGIETSFYKDPMSASVYAQLPDELHHEVKTEKTITKLTHEFLTHEKLRAEENIQDMKVSDASFLTEADEHFDKAIEEHKKVSGSEVISNITAKYDLDLVQSTSHQESKSEESQMILQEITSDAKKNTETATSSTSKEETKTEKSELSSESTTITITKDPIESWGKPLGLPSPIMPPTQSDGKSTPKKQNPMLNKNKLNQDKIKEARKSSESPSKRKPPAPVYLELTYVPHHGNSYYSAVEFFKRVRARYYVFSGTEPSKEIYNALLDAKKTWEDKDLEVTIIPTYDTDVLGYWVTENEDALEQYKIDLSPSASRCTINLQDHETSCAAYRLEF